MIRISIETNVAPPMPTTLVGAVVEGNANFMTAAWVSRVNTKPPMIAVAVHKGRHTRKGMVENKTFSVCIPSVEMEEVTDYCGVVSGSKVDKSKLFDVFYGELGTAPMIVECPVNIECKLSQIVELPTHGLFIGEVVAAYSEDRFLTDGKPDIRKINPILLTLPDRRYWAFGEQIGTAWKDGLKYQLE
ncbi:flavin reductase family protein [Thermodesulfobacteriota bacterium]